MRTTDRLLSLALGCALAACQGEPAPSEPDPAPASHESTGSAASPSALARRKAIPPRVITLLTGHRVTVRDGRAITVDAPARGRSNAVHSYRAGDHLYVVPVEVESLVRRGQLDRRLFDITGLIELEYDDAHRSDLPIIVTYRSAGRSAQEAKLTAAGAKGVRPLASIGGAAMRAPKRAAAGIYSALAGGRASGAKLADPVTKVWLDGKRKTVLDLSAPQIGAPTAWAAGLTGQGVSVAVLDTGIATDHPDFAGRIAGARNFLDDTTNAADDFGHGTHVASILAGSGAAEGGRYRGIAPDAQLLIGKVCDQFGSCPDSAIIAAMEWAAASGAAVANLSLGGLDGPEIDPLEEAINTLTAEHGILFVAAAGNFPNCGGPDLLQVGSPSTADAALSVGAVDREDQIADFSCRGPRAGDGGVKPDITAPGVDIVAGRAPGTPVGDFDPVDDFYARLSGTSMATPHVAGAAAILAQQHPDWRAAELKAALMASARSTPDLGAFVEGAGRVDVAAAIEATVLADPATLAFGVATFPHDDDEPIERRLTYRNTGSSPVALQLALDVRDASGAPAPDGMFTVAPAEVTVPASGEVIVVVTADTRVASPDGFYGGVLVATGDGQSVRAPVSLNKEVASYELTVDVIDRDGASINPGFLVIDVEAGEIIFGDAPLRLPIGTYVVDSTFFAVDASDVFYAAMLVQPRLELTGPTSITFDARLAEPVQVSVPAPATARRALEVVDYTTVTGNGSAGASLLTFDPDGSFSFTYTAQVGESLEPGQFVSIITSFWAEPGDLDDPFTDSPYIFNTSFVAADDGFPTGFAPRVRTSQLATIKNEYAQSTPDLLAAASDFGLPLAASAGIVWGTSTFMHPPSRRTSHYLTDDLEWLRVFREWGTDFFPQTELEPLLAEPLQPRTTTRDAWNQAVIGPNLDFNADFFSFVTRFGNEIDLFGPSYYTDRARHYGFSWLESGTARLFREGELIGESGNPSFAFFPVPADPASYRLEVESIKGGDGQLSTVIDLAWTFRSETADFASLPVLTATFSPALDNKSSAPANRLFVLPVKITRQAGAETPPVTDLDIDASYDRGQTWQRALVIRVGDTAVALIRHPRAGGGTVSLRTTATDRDGNTMEQTIRDAYHLRR